MTLHQRAYRNTPLDISEPDDEDEDDDQRWECPSTTCHSITFTYSKEERWSRVIYLECEEGDNIYRNEDDSEFCDTIDDGGPTYFTCYHCGLEIDSQSAYDLFHHLLERA